MSFIWYWNVITFCVHEKMQFVKAAFWELGVVTTTSNHRTGDLTYFRRLWFSNNFIRRIILLGVDLLSVQFIASVRVLVNWLMVLCIYNQSVKCLILWRGQNWYFKHANCYENLCRVLRKIQRLSHGVTFGKIGYTSNRDNAVSAYHSW